MALTREQVEHVALLSRLALTEEQIERMTHQLAAILGYIEKLNELDTGGIEPLSRPLKVENVFREDKPGKSLDREDALKNAPAQRKGFFEVPRIIQ
jgi:aspartyl-tRNA(Asn)/glutamyl-tRNA(Gln) amidotransferase subunit C